MLIRKEVARPGDYYYTGNDGQPRKLTVTPGDDPFDGSRVGVKYLFAQGQDMLAEGLPIPVPINHDFSNHPLTPQEEVTNNAGQVQKYEVDAENRLFAHLDIADHKINREDLGRTIKWTSPWFNSFTDGKGKQWNGVISHVALTTRPRMLPQEPFPSVAMAISAAKPAGASQAGFAISRAGLLKDDKPLYPLAFSLYSGIPMAEGEYGDDKPKKKDKGDKPDGGGNSSKTPKKGGDNPFAKGNSPDEGEEESVTDDNGGDDFGGGSKMAHKFDPMTGEPIETPLVDPDGDVSVYSVIAELLEILEPPIILGEDVTPENFCEKLFKAVMEAVKSKGSTPMPEPTPTVPEPNPTKPDQKQNPIVQEQAPLYMGLGVGMTPEQAKAALSKVTDPSLKALISAAFSQQEQTLKTAESLKKNAMASARARRDERIQKVLRHLPQSKRDQLLAMSASMSFSLGEDGVVTDQMASVLDIVESAIKEQPDLFRTVSDVQPHPREYDGEMSPERRKEIVGELVESSGITK